MGRPCQRQLYQKPQFEAIPPYERLRLHRSLGHQLRRSGRIVILASSPQIYVHEWASFSTKNFPENKTAKSGDQVRIVMLDVEDKRPVVDVLWKEEDHLEVFRSAELVPIKTYQPLAKHTEPYSWVSETTIAPWVIYVLEKG